MKSLLGLFLSTMRQVQGMWENNALNVNFHAAVSVLDRRSVKFGAFLLLSALYFVSVYGNSLAKPLWYDELFTIHIARLPTLFDIWRALAVAADVNPPFAYIAPRLALQILGDSEMSARLPSALGFWVMSLCLYRFVSKRLGNAAGLVAALFPVLTTAHAYAYEARPYGLVLGFCSTAWVCWQEATPGRLRQVALVGLAVSTALALLSHYYAVLFLVALAGGEIVRSLETRQMDFAVWASLLIGGLTLLVCLPLIHSTSSFAGLVVSQPATVASVYTFYLFLLNTFRFSLFALGLTAVLFLAVSRITAGSQIRDAPSKTPPRSELAAAVLMAIYPLYVLGLALAVTKAFNYRYALPATIGVSILVAYSVHLLGRTYLLLSRIAAIIIVGLFGLMTAQAAPQLAHGKVNALDSYPLLVGDQSNLPIVLPDYETYLQVHYYASAPLADQIVYLTNSDSNTIYIDDLILGRLRTIVPLSVYNYQDFIHSHLEFLVYQRAIRPWFLRRVLADGGFVQLIGQGQDETMYRVEMGK